MIGDFLKEEPSTRAQYPADLAQGCGPLRNMMNNPNVNHRIKARIGCGNRCGIGDGEHQPIWSVRG